MKKSTPAAQASASASGPASSGSPSTAPASASVTTDKKPRRRLLRPVSEYDAEFASFMRVVNARVDDLLTKIRRETPSYGKYFGGCIAMFAIALGSALVLLWLIDLKTENIGHTVNLDGRFEGQTAKLYRILGDERDLRAQERKEDREILARIEKLGKENLDVQRSYVDVAKAVAESLDTVASQAQKIPAIEEAVAALRDDVGESKALAEQAALEIRSELSAIRTKVASTATAQASSERASYEPLPRAPLEPPSPPHSIFGGQRVSKGDVSLSKEKWTHVVVTPGMESPKMSLSDAERSIIVQSGRTVMRHYFRGLSEPVDVVIPPSGEIRFYKNAYRISFISDQPMQIWTQR